MERTPTQGGDQPLTPEAPLPPEHTEQEHRQETGDERLIREGIEQAIRDGADIDDRTARYIAAQLHEGQASALYSLASTGAIPEEVHAELTRDFDQQSDQARSWINWLGEYCLHREWKGPVTGWVEQAEAQDRAELLARITAAGVQTLGEVASVVDAGSLDEEPAAADDEQVDGPGTYFSWADAASWSPDQDQPDELARGWLDELLAQIPDTELRGVEDMGWFGLLWHDERPGGIVLSQTGYGVRSAWETESNEELAAHWDELVREWEAYTAATRARAREDDPTSAESRSDHHPEVWVGSLSDYNAGHLHGAWLDATLEAEELQAAIQFMLRNGYDRQAEEWAIMDHSDFCGADISEYESLDTVSRIARGVAEHGEAFAKWCGYLGTTDMDEVERTFSDAFEGKFESTKAYVEYILSERGIYEALDDAVQVIPDDVRQYVKVDEEQLAHDWEIEMYVVEAKDGGVLVFDPRV